MAALEDPLSCGFTILFVLTWLTADDDADNNK